MTVLVQNTNTTNTFDFWRNRTNELATAMSTVAVTVNSNTTVGNASVNGYITATGFIGNIQSTTANLTTINAVSISANSANLTYITTANVQVGNVSVNTTAFYVGNSTANLVITQPTAAQISNGQYYFNANSSWSLLQTPYNPASNGASNTSGIVATIIDSWLKSSYNAADYTLSVVDNTANNRQFSKLLVVNDGSNALTTEYAVVTTNNSIGYWSASSNTTHIVVYFNPSSTNTAVRYTRVIV